MRKTFKERNIFISTNKCLVNIEEVYEYLLTTPWGIDIPYEFVKTAVNNSLFFGIYRTNNELIGFGRVISDFSTFAYIADIFIKPEYRSNGFAKLLVDTILIHPKLQNQRRILLATRDAHKLYEKSGFLPVSKPQSFMEIYNPNIYQKLLSDE